MALTHFGADDFREFRAVPVFVYEHGVGLGERMQAAQDSILCGPNGVFACKTARHHRMHDGEEVLCSVLDFARQQRLPCLSLLLLGDIARDFGGAGDVARIISYWRDCNGYVDQLAILAVTDRFVGLWRFSRMDALQRGILSRVSGRGRELFWE